MPYSFYLSRVSRVRRSMRVHEAHSRNISCPSTRIYPYAVQNYSKLIGFERFAGNRYTWRLGNPAEARIILSRDEPWGIRIPFCRWMNLSAVRILRPTLFAVVCRKRRILPLPPFQSKMIGDAAYNSHGLDVTSRKHRIVSLVILRSQRRSTITDRKNHGSLSGAFFPLSVL